MPGNKNAETENDLELVDSPVSGESTPPPANNDAGEGDGGKKKPDQNKKMGLATFIQLSGPNKYVETILKSKRAMEVHTQIEWQQIIDDLLKAKV